jgi:hypothetical protein
VKKYIIQNIIIIFAIFLMGGRTIIGAASASSAHEAPLSEIHKRATSGRLEERLRAIREIGRRRMFDSVDILVQIFQRHNPGRSSGEWIARVAAVRVLREYKREGRLSDKALRPLVRLLFGERNKKIQSEAAITIGYVAKFGRESDKTYAINMLAKKLKNISDDDNLIALMIIKGFKYLGSKSALKALSEVLHRDFILLVKMECRKAISYLKNING